MQERSAYQADCRRYGAAYKPDRQDCSVRLNAVGKISRHAQKHACRTGHGNQFLSKSGNKS